jgi:hypothetical protein
MQDYSVTIQVESDLSLEELENEISEITSEWRIARLSEQELISTGKISGYVEGFYSTYEGDYEPNSDVSISVEESSNIFNWSIEYDCIRLRKSESDEKNSESNSEEISIPLDWVNKNIDKKSLDNEEFAEWALGIDGLLLEHFSNKIRSNVDLVKVAINNNIKSVKFIEINLNETKEDFEKAMSIYDYNFIYMPEKLKKSEFVKHFISKNISEENYFNTNFVMFSRSFLDEEINKLIDKAIQKELCSDPWENDGDALNSYAWDIYDNRNLIPNSNNELYRASICCKRAIDVKKDHFILDTYAHVLFAMGDFDQALIQEKEAIELAETSGEDATDYKEFLGEIKKQKK